MPTRPSSEARTTPRRRLGLGPKAVGSLIGLCASALAGPALAAQIPAGTQAGGRIPAAEAPFRIVAFGSSSTQGAGASSPAASYPADLERLFDDAFHARPAVAVLNRGIGGEDIDDMVRRLKPDVLSRKPDLVIWQVGSNDPLRGVPVERFGAELKAGIGAIRATGAEVMLMEPQWSPTLAAVDDSRQFVEAVRAIGRDEHALVIRRYELMERWMAEGLATRQELIGPDNLHMTDKGYAMLAKAVFIAVSTGSAAFRDHLPVAVSNRP